MLPSVRVHVYGTLNSRRRDIETRADRRDETLAGWYSLKPHRVWLAQQLSRASTCWYMREQQRGTVSSTSTCQTALFQQYSANISLPIGPAVCNHCSWTIRCQYACTDICGNLLDSRSKVRLHLQWLQSAGPMNVYGFDSVRISFSKDELRTKILLTQHYENTALRTYTVH